jgi:hypothetical protein
MNHRTHVPGCDVIPSSRARDSSSALFLHKTRRSRRRAAMPIAMNWKRTARLFLLSTTLVTTTAFVPLLLQSMRYQGAILLFFQNGEADAEMTMPTRTLQTIATVPPVLRLPRAGDAATTSQKTLSHVKKSSAPAKSKHSSAVLPFELEQRPHELVLPTTAPPGSIPSAIIKTKKQPEFIKLSQFASINKKWKSLRDRPGLKFRLRLGIVTAVALVVSGVVLKHRMDTSIVVLTKEWLNQRGFQGLAALGRSVVYLWGLLVAYPIMLDRRADERHRQQVEKDAEKRREKLNRLAGEIVRLATLDAEVRSFRREVILLKVYARDDNGEVQAAIEAEMSHLAQLRSDTKAALTAARQVWSEYRSTSPPEVVDDAVVP